MTSSGVTEPLVTRATVADGFAEVAAEFERNFAERGELGASLNVRANGETVLDLWGGTTASRDTVNLVPSRPGVQPAHRRGPDRSARAGCRSPGGATFRARDRLT
ncbi:MAG: hypothetical protein O3C27_09740 [Actinomycetota bacterium]|nr:hypothetical protein [Actinomycetota bacterium]